MDLSFTGLSGSLPSIREKGYDIASYWVDSQSQGHASSLVLEHAVLVSFLMR